MTPGNLFQGTIKTQPGKYREADKNTGTYKQTAKFGSNPRFLVQQNPEHQSNHGKPESYGKYGSKDNAQQDSKRLEMYVFWCF